MKLGSVLRSAAQIFVPATTGQPVYLVRNTNLVTDAQVAAIAKACDTQITRDVAPAYGMLPSRVVVSTPDKIPVGSRIIWLIDDTGNNTLGWHTEDPNDYVAGVVGVGTVMRYSGKVLTGAQSVAAITSHEVVELVGNPHVSMWSDTGKGYLVAAELCDPVQSDYYDVGGVSVSNFVLEDWFSPVVSPGDKFDFLGRLAAPYTVSRGGYVLQLKGGVVTPVFGADFPDWLWKMKKREHTRTNRLSVGRPA